MCSEIYELEGIYMMVCLKIVLIIVCFNLGLVLELIIIKFDSLWKLNFFFFCVIKL